MVPKFCSSSFALLEFQCRQLVILCTDKIIVCSLHHRKEYINGQNCLSFKFLFLKLFSELLSDFLLDFFLDCLA